MWTYIVAGLIALTALATILGEVKSYLAGVKESGRVEAQQECLAAATAQRQKEQLASETAAQSLEADKAKSKVQVKTIERVVEKIVEKPIYRNTVLDPAGLSCVNAAIKREVAPGCKLD